MNRVCKGEATCKGQEDKKRGIHKVCNILVQILSFNRHINQCFLKKNKKIEILKLLINHEFVSVTAFGCIFAHLSF